MASTLNRKESANQHHPLNPPGYAQNGGTHIPLGSEGSSRGSEPSSGGDLDGQLPENVDIEIVLPDNNIKCLTVDYGKQMMDLLVQVTASHRLSPATHTFQLFSEETGRVVEYYASQPVGSLGITTLHLIEKKTELQRKRERQSSALTFERTYRLTVNLPKNQKMITRVSPKSTLADIYKMVCSEKNLDPYKYELRHPTKPDEALNMASPLGDYQLTEITVVAIGPESRHSISRLSLDSTDLNDSRSSTATWQKSSTHSSSTLGAFSSGTMEKKKKKGIFSIFSKKKEGKFKVSEATYNDSTSNLPSSGSTSLAGSSHVTNNNYTTPSSKERGQSQKSSKKDRDLSFKNKDRDKDNNNVSSAAKGKQQQIPPKPPRKKRQAPPPPSYNVEGSSDISSLSPSVSLNQSHTQEAIQTTKIHSRGSSHSSGFESAGSPIESPGTNRGDGGSSTQHDRIVVESQSSESLKASKVVVQKDVRPKEPIGTRKKRRAPAPPGVPKVQGGSESSPTDISTPRLDDISSLGREQGALSQINLPAEVNSLENEKTNRPNPVFLPPPPPDTPPPLDDMSAFPTIPPPLSNDYSYGSGVQGDVEVADSSTQVHVTNRDSLSSDLKSRDSYTLDVRDESTSAITGSRLSSVSSEHSVISESLELENPVYIEPNRKSDVAEFVDQMTILTEQIDENTSLNKDIQDTVQNEDTGLSPRSAISDDKASFTEDSLHTSSSETASLDNYNFGVQDDIVEGIEPALPTSDTSVVLLRKKKILPDDSFYSNDSYTANHSSSNLAESQDSGIGSLTKPPKEFADSSITGKSYAEEMKPEEETEFSVGYTTVESSRKSQKYSSSGNFGANDDNADKYSVDSLDLLETPASDSGISGESGSLERENNRNKTLSVTEEITIDQSEVMYVAPGGPKPDVEDDKSTESKKVFTDDEKLIESATESSCKDSSNEEPKNTSKTNTDHEPKTLIIEKPKLSHELSSAMRPEDKVVNKKNTTNVTNYENLNDPDLNKLMSYVVSAKSKSGESEAPISPGAESNKGSSFFVDVSENHQQKKLQSRSLENFGSQDISRIDPFYRTESKPSMTITTLEYRSEKTSSDGRPPRGRDTYSKPVSSLREAYGKTVNREPEFTIRSVTQSKNPSYSFYRTETKEQPLSGRRSKDPIESNKRHSTIIMASRGEKVHTTRNKHSDYFMGPRPYGGGGRQASEPSVRDVRKALAINEDKHIGGRESPSSNEVANITDKQSPIKEQCSKIGFSPHSEQESDSVLEEKSISQINLPAERKSVMKPRQQYRPKSSIQLTPLKSESMENVSNLQPRSPTNKITKSTENVFDVTLSAREKSRKTLQSQYDELQQQFSKWQEQLMDNQALLSKRASRTIGSPKGTGDQDTVTSLRPGRVSNLKTTSQFDRRRTIDVVENPPPVPYESSNSDHQPLTHTQSGDIKTSKIESHRLHKGPRYGSLTEGVPRMGTNAALGSKVTSDELTKARIKLRQNSTEEQKAGNSMRFNGDGTSTRITRPSYGSSIGSEPISPAAVTSLPKHSTPFKEGYIPPSYNEPSSPTSPTVSDGFHRREKTRKYGAQPNRRKGSGAGSVPKPAFEPQLHPREELMIAIRNAGGRGTLRKVTVGETHWVQGADTTTF